MKGTDIISSQRKLCPDHGDTDFSLKKFPKQYWCCNQCWNETSWNEDTWRHQESFLMHKFKDIV